MGLDIAFWVLAVVSITAALAVVLLQNIFRKSAVPSFRQKVRSHQLTWFTVPHHPE